MTRLIKRYGSRKLYDTKESRYVSLEDIAKWVREGEVIQVVDNASSEDVTVQTLTQVISEEGRKGGSALPSDLLHDLIRVGGSAVTDRVKKIQTGVDTFFRNSIDRLVPVSKVREEMVSLRNRLDELETAITAAEAHTQATPAVEEAEAPKAEEAPAAKAPAKKKTTRSTTKKAAAAKSDETTEAAKPKRTTRRSTSKASSGTRRTRSSTTKTDEPGAQES
ncbi:polyhydroxyalkanoate synthesis regulator DNA-binding domain-containing protein [Acanthopleuribacter pedis]|uniref:Polyhydroxyalkanoate synthesis regulator DNA-binding domain-containing protein n=1 Tax=Acanthopleuribacter pedis TaxID=442870 RepID=A0A8J7U480_9BACT|nr:polyhydroxyalkanoate synthesis regulator DNA-binding domain-containing protein [Acanthopleuribacter pedis]MBO1319544.1 polyhydroxyalkanoate synthesis regulator DNA-binding domain-containing protein [Acanthopleuribacter pedis]